MEKRYWITLEDGTYGYFDYDPKEEKHKIPEVGDWMVITYEEDEGQTIIDHFGKVAIVHNPD